MEGMKNKKWRKEKGIFLNNMKIIDKYQIELFDLNFGLMELWWILQLSEPSGAIELWRYCTIFGPWHWFWP